MRIGVDIGGSNLAAGLVDDQGKILRKASVPTNAERGLEPVLEDIRKLCRDCADGVDASSIESIGVGSPGLVDREKGLLQYSNNLPFNDTPIGQILRDDWGVPVYVENDANCAALGELYAGAAVGAENVVVITIGTGVGGGVILNGRLFSGAGGAGAELGHMVIRVDGEPCSCGRKGCWEAYASATALKRETLRAMENAPESQMWALCEGKTENISARTPFEAAKQGDMAAGRVVEQYIRCLSAGLINIANIFRPECICLGGGVSNEEDPWLLDPVRTEVEKEVYAFSRCPVRVIKARLGNDAGIIGAAFLYRQ